MGMIIGFLVIVVIFLVITLLARYKRRKNKSLDRALAKNSVVIKKDDIVKHKIESKNIAYLSKSEIEKKIREIRKAMENAAKSLDFIEAAKFRDEIKILQDQL